MSVSNIFEVPTHEELMNRARELKASYQTAKPFPHIVMDNFFSEKLLGDVLEEFPGPDHIKWRTFNDEYQIKLASRGENQFGEITKRFMHYMNSATMLDFLSELTGIPNLIADPYFNGGGMHQIKCGGHLKIHADFNKDSRTNLDRRLNLLVYLNKDWPESYGGHFELWDKTMSKAEVKILPLFNRVAIFSTTSDSYHGHPNQLTCPPDRTRKSLALYYYTLGRKDEGIEEVKEAHSTLFKMREGEEHLADKVKARETRRQMRKKIKSVIKSFVPPILFGKIKD